MTHGCGDDGSGDDVKAGLGRPSQVIMFEPGGVRSPRPPPAAAQSRV